MSKEFFTRTLPIAVTTGMLAAGCSPAENPETDASTPPPAIEMPAPETQDQCFYGYHVIGTLVLSAAASDALLNSGKTPAGLDELKPANQPPPQLLRYVIDQELTTIGFSGEQAIHLEEVGLTVRDELDMLPSGSEVIVGVMGDETLKEELSAQGRTEGYVDVPAGQLAVQTSVVAREPTCIS